MISPGTERAIQQLADQAPKILKELVELRKTMTKKEAPRELDEVTIPLSLTHDEWNELYYSLLTKTQLVKEGTYTESSQIPKLGWRPCVP